MEKNAVTQSPKGPATQTYKVAKEFRQGGVLQEVGKPIELTTRQAKYPLMEGKITPPKATKAKAI